MSLAFYINGAGLSHDTGPGHPECAARLQTLLDLLDENAFSALPRIDVPAADIEQIARAHTARYIHHVETTIPREGLLALNPDTIVSPGSWDAGLRSAGAACAAVDGVLAGKSTRAFCATRPPGHHAEPERTLGFCLFNNVFIAARHAQAAHGVNKIAIVDFDVHHGNGTDAMTRLHDHDKHGEILYVSSHEFPLFPGTGLPEDNEDHVLNFIMPAGSGSRDFRRIYETGVFPALDSFKPDLLMMSAGFDAHRLDPLAHIELDEEDFGWVTRGLLDAAGGVPTVATLEGGYNLEALKASARAHFEALAA